ncbi:macro domain-like protein, partial [Leucogyrophana mollusca]
FDCIVSPANSYGIMDGGFDYYLSAAFSPSKDIMALTRLVQSAIKSRYYGFAPPGSCILVPDLPPNRFACRIIAVCPTMRLPTELQWHKDIVYNTMWALLVEIERWNQAANDDDKIKKVLMTGLGTGVGRIAPDVCAQQMALAVKHFL